MIAVRPRRSVLYVPGSNARAIENAHTLPADALILDLEDLVAPEAKDASRSAVCAVVAARGFGAREVVIRVNAAGTPWSERDIVSAIAARPDAILLPKISGPRDLAAIEKRMDAAKIALWAMIETPRAILDIGQLAGARLACLVMGTNDLIKEMHARPCEDRRNIMGALTLCVVAARAHGLFILDGVFNEMENAAGFRAACEQARDFGFDGKTLIHPGQIAPCNEIFTPSAQEVESAREIIAAFALPQNKGKGAIRLGERMIEPLDAENARRIIAMADAH